MVSQTFAYIDETGNSDLETIKTGASSYFIVSAVIVSKEKRDKLVQDVEVIRKKYFQSGEIKSSGVGNNSLRRSKILNAVNNLDFKFYTLCVDKERIKKDSGLQYKRSFLKYVNGKLYNLLFQTYLDLHIIADEHGGDEFKLSFENYIDKNHKPDMFYKSKFDLVNSKDEVLVQLSDFIVGTISKIYEGNRDGKLYEAYITLLKNRALSIDEWPTKFQTYYPKDTTSDEFSQLIYQCALAKAEIFIEENEKKHEIDTQLQIATLRHLVFHSRMINKKDYITTTKLIEFLRNSGFNDVTSYAIRSKIIAPLRDFDVIVTSSNKGYKIPCSFTDMEEFVERVNSIVTPLMSRLGKARKSLKLASNDEVDILKGPNYPHLVDFIDKCIKFLGSLLEIV